MKSRLVIVFFLCCAVQAIAQDFKTLNYTVSDGLPSTETYDVFQDSKGFLWFAGDNGVCRYDGSEIEVFHVKDGLTDPVVFGFSEDHKGRVWFRTYSGKICYYQDGRIIPYAYNDILKSLCEYRILMSLYCDTTDRIWFGVGSILGSISARGVVDTTMLNNYEVAINVKSGTALLAYGGVTNQLKSFLFEGKRYPIRQSDTLRAYHVVRHEWWNQKMYLSINNNVFEYANGTFRPVLQAAAPIICLARDRENNFWVGYLNGGVERFTHDFSKPSLRLLENKSVTKVLQDHEGGLWFSTLQNGIYYVPNANIERYVPENYEKIKTIVQKDGLIIAGDNTGQVTATDPETRQIRWQMKFKDPINSLYKTKRNELWISTTNRSYLYDENQKLIQTNNVGRSWFAEDHHDITWSINGSMVYRSDHKGNIIKGLARDIFRSVYFADTLLFFAGRSGLHIYDTNLSLVLRPKELEDKKISQLHRLNDSTFLVTTIGHGFALLNIKSWRSVTFNTSGRFIADNVYTALIKGSDVWLGTDKGIAVTSISSLLAGEPRFSFINEHSGLLSDKINFLIDGGSKIWAYCDEGISLLDERGRTASEMPLFVWNKITINDLKVTDTSNLELAYNQNNIELEYKAIAFNNEHILFRYRITQDEPWVTSANKKIILYSLAPGRYKFEIQYSADNLRWRTALPPLSFTIALPWYRQWYTYALLTIFLGMVGYLYFRHLRSIYKEKNQYLTIINDHQQRLIQSEVAAIERERNRIAKELHDGVGTNLTAIKHSVRQVLQGARNPKADDIEEQFQVTISEIKNIIYDLSPPSLERYGLFTALKNYINRISKTIEIPIEFKSFGNDVDNFNLNIIVFRIMQELISNSIKHSGASVISIHMNTFDDLLNIIYEDNGKGFDYDPVQSGLGLDNVESRIRSINGTLKFESGDFGVSYTIDIPLTTDKIKPSYEHNSNDSR